jgi:hypothetical protein
MLMNHHLGIKMKIFFFLFLLFITFTAQASPMEIAITIDDLPKHMDLLPNTTRLDVAKKMIQPSKFIKNFIANIPEDKINNLCR